MKGYLLFWLLGAGLIWSLFAIAAFVIFSCTAQAGWVEAIFTGAGALFSALAFSAIYCTVTAQQEEIEQQRLRFQKQTELAALTAYAEITKALWEHNTVQAQAKDTEPGEQPGQRSWWSNAAGVRYKEMIEAKEAFEKILRAGGVIGKAKNT